MNRLEVVLPANEFGVPGRHYYQVIRLYLLEKLQYPCIGQAARLQVLENPWCYQT